MKKDNLVYIEDILTSIKKIESYISHLTYDQFISDDKTIDAVLRNLEVGGEAARCLTGEFQDEHPDFPISVAISMRNFITHEYKKIDLKIIWGTAKKDLPKLKKQIEEILKNLP